MSARKSRYLTKKLRELKRFVKILLIRMRLRSEELKIYSQFGEDGLITYIFSKVGAKNHTFVEIGGGKGLECITANLSINLGWKGIIIDGDKENISSGKRYYKKIASIRPGQVKFVHMFVTKENVDRLLKKTQTAKRCRLSCYRH